MGKILSKAILCGIAGLVAWLITEPGLPRNAINSPAWAKAEQMMVFAIVALIGLAAGAFQGAQKGGQRNIAIAAALGCVFGAVGGLLGYSIGGAMGAALFPPDVFGGGVALPVAIIARIVVMVPLGACLGAAIGGTQMSGRALMSGALGGLIGGAAGGAMFDIVGSILGPLVHSIQGTAEVGVGSRALLGTSLGFFVGLFTGIMDSVTRQAWLRLVLARNEGKEWPIDNARTNIGRDERADVPLFGDGNVAALHAVIHRDSHSYTLQDVGTPIGIGLNGQRVQGVAPLSPGDIIMVGNHQLMFMMRQGAARQMQEGRVAAQPVGRSVQPIQTIAAPFTPQAMTPTPGTNSGPNYLQLRVLTGPLQGQLFSVAGPMELGRESGAIPMSGDTQASRRHAQLVPIPDGLALTDLNSTNGTFVNGQRVAQATLRPGDQFRVGSTEFRLET